MASKLDQIIPVADQIAWVDSPLRDEAEGLRAPPVISDDPYDERLHRLLTSQEWPAFAAFLRGYIENGVLKPFETQPAENRAGWWNITVDEGAKRVHINIWRQYTLEIDFRYGSDAQPKANGTVWIDKETTERALSNGASLPATFAVEPTSLQGRELGVLALRLKGPSWNEVSDVFNSDWVVRAIRILNLDLMRGGQLNFGWQRHHVPKLVDAIFSEPLDSETPAENAAAEMIVSDAILQTEIDSIVWRRKNVHRFAEPVIRRAGNKCQVSRVEAVELLQACHIKPWSESEDSERLDPNNGVCLAAHVHAAFDAQLIGIKPDGEVVYSDHLSADDRRRLNLPEFVRLEVLSDQRRYLAYRFDKYTRTQELES